MAITYTPIAAGQDFNLVKSLAYKVGRYVLIQTALGGARAVIKVFPSVRKALSFLRKTTALADYAIYWIKGADAFLVSGLHLHKHLSG